jgi:hypothetical protein
MGFFILASVVAELLAILWFFAKWKLRNMSGTGAATWWQKQAVDIPSFEALKYLQQTMFLNCL